ncbi:MAG: hypothetical protein RIR00_2703 [Pseudomonadota bacterium]
MTSVTVTSNADGIRIRIAAAGDDLGREIDSAMGRAAQEVAREGKRLAPKAFSTLTNAIIASRIGPGSWMARAGTQYARYVEEGTRRGGWPPRQTLTDWVRVKRIVPHTPGMSDERLVAVIRRSIAAKGTPAQPFMAPALEGRVDRIRQLIEDAVTAALGRLT